MKKITLFAFVALFMTACTSSSNENHKTQVTKKQAQPAKNVAATPAKYCQSVGGKVKTVESSEGAFCLLPGGEVIKLQEFYNNNHK